MVQLCAQLLLLPKPTIGNSMPSLGNPLTSLTLFTRHPHAQHAGDAACALQINRHNIAGGKGKTVEPAPRCCP